MGAMLGWWARLVDVRPGERRRVAAMFTLLGLIIATSYILKPVRSSLFLSQFGSERLPYVYILVALVLAIVAFAFARWSRRANLPRLFIGAAYFFAANLVFFWLATTSGWSWTGFVFYVWVSIFTALMPSLFWLLANYVFYANEGRRLFPVVMAGGLFGSIVVVATTSVLVGFIGTPALLLTAAGLLVGIAALIRSNVAHERERMSERRAEIARQEKSRVIRSDENPWTLIARSRYLSMLAILIVLTPTTSTLVDYQFNTVVDQSFDSMDALTGFFGTFFAAINVVAFVLQLVFVGRLLGRFGVAAGLVMLPVALLGSSLSFLLFPSATHGSSHQIVRRRPQQLRQQSQCRSPLFTDRARGKEPAQSVARFVRRACQPRFGGRHRPRSDDAFLALGVSDECRRGRATRSVDCLGVSVAPGVRQEKRSPPSNVTSRECTKSFPGIPGPEAVHRRG